MSETTTATSAATSSEVVREFLETLQANDLVGAMKFLTDDAVWINVSLPTVRSKRKIEGLLRVLDGGSFRVHFHNIAEQGDVVLTERTDAIGLGRFEQRFWVYGRFELRDGKIAVWRDSFDWGDILVSLLRAAFGVISPRLNRAWPGN